MNPVDALPLSIEQKIDRSLHCFEGAVEEPGPSSPYRLSRIYLAELESVSGKVRNSAVS